MSKSKIKYTVYMTVSILLISVPFLLTLCKIFKEDLNGLALIFIIFPLSVFAHGILSALMLKGRARLAYIIASPIYSAVALPTLLFLLSPGAVPSFENYLNGFSAFFTYPIFIFTLGVVITGWLGMIAVRIFERLMKKSDALLSKSELNGR